MFHSIAVCSSPSIVRTEWVVLPIKCLVILRRKTVLESVWPPNNVKWNHTLQLHFLGHMHQTIRRRIVDSYCSITKLRLLFWTYIEYHNWKFRMIYNIVQTISIGSLSVQWDQYILTSRRREKKVVEQSFRWSSMHTNGFMASKFKVEWFFQTYYYELLGCRHINIISWYYCILFGYQCISKHEKIYYNGEKTKSVIPFNLNSCLCVNDVFS